MDYKQLVAACNELARKFYKMQGYEAPPGFKFYDSTHPHEVSLWNEAVAAYDYIKGDDVDDALNELRDDEGA